MYFSEDWLWRMLNENKIVLAITLLKCVFHNTLLITWVIITIVVANNNYYKLLLIEPSSLITSFTSLVVMLPLCSYSASVCFKISWKLYRCLHNQEIILLLSTSLFLGNLHLPSQSSLLFFQSCFQCCFILPRINLFSFSFSLKFFIRHN